MFLEVIREAKAGGRFMRAVSRRRGFWDIHPIDGFGIGERRVAEISFLVYRLVIKEVKQ